MFDGSLELELFGHDSQKLFSLLTVGDSEGVAERNTQWDGSLLSVHFVVGIDFFGIGVELIRVGHHEHKPKEEFLESGDVS
jgi:hypothetical protein